MRRPSSIVLELSLDIRAPIAPLDNPDLVDRHLTMMLDEWHDDVLPPVGRMEDAIAVDPAMANILGGIEDDPPIHAVDEVEVPEVWEKVRLHDGQLHSLILTGRERPDDRFAACRLTRRTARSIPVVRSLRHTRLRTSLCARAPPHDIANLTIAPIVAISLSPIAVPVGSRRTRAAARSVCGSSASRHRGNDP